jgi:hypothetical protein
MLVHGPYNWRISDTVLGYRKSIDMAHWTAVLVSTRRIAPQSSQPSMLVHGPYNWRLSPKANATVVHKNYTPCKDDCRLVVYSCYLFLAFSQSLPLYVLIYLRHSTRLSQVNRYGPYNWRLSPKANATVVHKNYTPCKDDCRLVVTIEVRSFALILVQQFNVPYLLTCDNLVLIFTWSIILMYYCGISLWGKSPVVRTVHKHTGLDNVPYLLTCDNLVLCLR